MLARPEWALCLGGASCVWEDVLAWETMYGQQWDGLVIAANDIGSHWPRELHHWVSLHPDKFQKWEALRRAQQMPACSYVTWGRDYRMKEAPQSDRVITPWPPGGSSGLLAIQVASLLGCTRAVLCGIPMTMTPHFQETKEMFGATWAASAGYWRAWNRNHHLMQGWVRSMSGRTQELLGAPTKEWLLATS